MENLWNKYHLGVEGFVRRRIEDETVVEELTNDILMAAYGAKKNFRGESEEFSWICGIAKHKVVDYYRKKKIKTILFSVNPAFEEIADKALTPEKDVLKNVQLCWSSLFTPRAIFYRIEQKLHKKPVSVAVVVQQMVQSEVAGICFTVHPVTKDYNQMVIEAGLGLGEAVVSGQITPDTYVIHKNDFSILDINVSEQTMMIIKGGKDNVHKKLSAKVGGKQKLTGQQIVELARICKNIEKHYGKPQDIEWALVKNKFYITQSRPITTL